MKNDNKIQICYIYGGYPISSQNVKSLKNEDELIHLDNIGIEFDILKYDKQDFFKVHMLKEDDIVKISRANKQIYFQLTNENYIKKI